MTIALLIVGIAILALLATNNKHYLKIIKGCPEIEVSVMKTESEEYARTKIALMGLDGWSVASHTITDGEWCVIFQRTKKLS